MGVQSQAAAPNTFLTASEFWDLPDIPGKHLELIDGRVVETPIKGVRHSELTFFIAVSIYQHARQYRLGWVGGRGNGYVIAGKRDSVLFPDASFIATDRIPTEGTPSDFWPFPPDLAVLVAAPGDKAVAFEERRRKLLEGGTRTVWTIWPKSADIMVSFADGTGRILLSGDDLEGGDVLPGFSVPVAEIFAVGEVEEKRPN